ncbi:glutathione S-transferase N-terminal domain-containing protein [Psychrosphaera sp. F3M07]|uniref:glutaredoxin domain-containing protein n=1 Tax=Psychrosphaera sp. F3M07 TaxID=2841560 RepID=UPI001C08DBF1|nr:glutaredoxin domain-containing protein [Psychrosphaera sp. F3M07]MBU2917648.1 glutathione S-transferase N-terminal domain-containing protein [Psychrosphaera sp. F3M07]
MKIIRVILGALILFLDWITTPRGVKREAKVQTEIDKKTQKLALYQYKACPFCVKVRRSMKRNSLKIATHDAKRNEQSRQELVNGGGQLKVPCLRIEKDSGEVQWMYESSDIINYLEQEFC